MKIRYLVILLAALALVVLTAGLALADPPADNGNVTILTNAICDDDSEFSEVIVPGQGVAGMDPNSNVVGIAKSLVLDPGGANILIWERGAQGNPNLVWCEWDGGPDHFGGYILFTPGGP